jgi:hypothetical protein
MVAALMNGHPPPPTRGLGRVHIYLLDLRQAYAAIDMVASRGSKVDLQQLEIRAAIHVVGSGVVKLLYNSCD